MFNAIFKVVGSMVIRLLRYIGQLAFLAGETATSIRVAPMRWALLFKQVAEIGFGSQLVVVVTGVISKEQSA